MRKKSYNKNDVIKVAFMGAAASGKSSIVQRLIKGDDSHFSEDYQPTVFEFHDFESKAGNTSKVTLQISDTAGAFSFPAMDRLTIQKSDVIVVVFDLSSTESLKHAVIRARDVKEQNPKKPILVIGNKSDLGKRVSSKMELEHHFTCHLQLSYLETSAKYEKIRGELIQRISEEFSLSNGPFDVKRSRKPLSAKLKRRLSKSTENLLDLF